MFLLLIFCYLNSQNDKVFETENICPNIFIIIIIILLTPANCTTHV